MREAKFLKGRGLYFWCDRCDAKLVNSDISETGKFFSQFGHVWNARNQSLEEWEMVIYAVCADCIDKEKE